MQVVWVASRGAPGRDVVGVRRLRADLAREPEVGQFDQIDPVAQQVLGLHVAVEEACAHVRTTSTIIEASSERTYPIRVHPSHKRSMLTRMSELLRSRNMNTAPSGMRALEEESNN